MAIVLTGVEDGYIEPCGCAGLERMKGGMSRRYAFFAELRKKGWPLVGLDVGGLAGLRPPGRIEVPNARREQTKMGYDAIAFGVDDLRLPAGELVSSRPPSRTNPARSSRPTSGFWA